MGTALIAKLFGVESRKQMSSRENDTNYSVIGQSVPRVDGMRKAAGQAIYADDITLREEVVELDVTEIQPLGLLR